MSWGYFVGAVNTGTDTSAETLAPGGSGGLLGLTVLVETAVTITTPTGWTSRANAANGNSSLRLAYFERLATGGADDTPTVTVGGGVNNWQTQIIRYTGQKASSPFDFAATLTNNTGTTPVLPSGTTAESGELIIGIVGTPAANVTGNPSGYTQRVQSEPTASTLDIYTKEVGAAGSYGGETVTLEVTSASVLLLIAYKVEPTDTPPTITSDGGGATATLTVNEGNTAITTVAANGTPTPTFSITGGADSGDFSIGSSTGVLTFAATPDYDSPADADANSVYVVEVTATNSQGTDVQTITVVVNPVQSVATATLPAPLNDALFYNRPFNYLSGNTKAPNLGTKTTVPFNLGGTSPSAAYQSDAHDPVYTDDTLDYWAYNGSSGNEMWQNILGTATELGDAGGGFTVAVRIKFGFVNVSQSIAIEMMDGADAWGDDNAGDTKVVFLHLQSDQTLEARVWDGTTNSQVSVVGATSLNTTNTYDIVMTYNSSTRKLNLYLNAVADGPEATVTNARRVRTTSGYLWYPYRSTILPLKTARYFRQAYWNRCLSGSEVTALSANWHWTTDATSAPGGMRIQPGMTGGMQNLVGGMRG